MPFAPVTLDAKMEECYEVIPAARASDEFMVITYRCTEFDVLRSPGVVHCDGTARPQRGLRDSQSFAPRNSDEVLRVDRPSVTH